MYCLCVVVPITDLEDMVRLCVEVPGVRVEDSATLQPALAASAHERKGMRCSTEGLMMLMVSRGGTKA